MTSFRIIPAVLAFFAMSLTVTAQMRIVPRERLQSVNYPRLSGDSASVLFDVRQIAADPMNEDDPPSVFRYGFTNVGNDPLHVRMVTTTCSCLSASCDRQTVAPGEKAYITARYNPEGHPGRFERRIFLYTQEGASPAAVLTLDVDVAAGPDLSDEYPVSMGPVRLRRGEVAFESGKKAVEKIRFMNLSGRTLALGCEELFLPDCITFETRPAEVRDGQEGELVIGYDPQKGECKRTVILMLKGLGLPPRQSAVTIRIE